MREWEEVSSRQHAPVLLLISPRLEIDAKRTSVIMLTSKSSSFDKVRGAMAGCNSYLTKPVDYIKFHKALDEYLA